MTDLDPLLRDAVASVRGPVGARPSLSDVRHRARRRNRRRMSVTAGVVVCAGVATTALIIRRDGMGSSVAGQSVPRDRSAASTLYQPDANQTTTIYGSPTMTIKSSSVWDALWNARYDPSGTALAIQPADQAAADVMPTPEQFGCTTNECRAMFTYVVWHEIARTIGFVDVSSMQAANPDVDFSRPPVEGSVLQTAYSDAVVTPTTSNFYTTTTFAIFEGILLIDGGAPVGAMDDALNRLSGYNPYIAAGTGRSVTQSILMPIADHDSIAKTVGQLLGIDGFDTWDQSWVKDPIAATAAVVIGPDYWDRVQHASSATTTTAPATTTTSIG